MRVDTPIGEYPLVLRGVERRGQGVAIVGLLAGLRSDLILERRELLALGAALAAALGVAAALGHARRASR